MLDKILPLAERFVSIKSIPENSKGLEEILEVALSNLKEFTIEKFEQGGSKSVLVYNSEKRPERFKIILNGHLDVIPGKEHQYIPKVEGDKLFGVGSMDMKSNVACLLMAFKEMANKVDYPLGLQLVTDEQIGGFNGTKHQVEKGVRADFVIAGEPTNFDIVNQAKGVLWLKISAKGMAAHGAYPWKGENAIWKMNDFLNVLKEKYPNPKKQEWVTTVNLSQIETGNKIFNKIPDDCLVGLDVRFVAEENDEILKNIKEILPEDFKLEILAEEPALNTDVNDEYLKALRIAGENILGEKIILRGAQGSSDARHYVPVGCAGVEFGPIGEGSGSDSEFVNIPSLEKYYEITKKFLATI